MKECLGVWDAIGQKVCRTNQIMSNRSNTEVVSVHSVNYDLDCPSGMHTLPLGFGMQTAATTDRKRSRH